jgi:dihydrofolate reductase
MKVSIIAAVARNGVIGKDNALPWRIDDDMRFFLSMTTGHIVITGRRNFEAMGQALPNRFNIVVSRDAGFAAPNVTRCDSLEQALALAEQGRETEAFIIGGAQIYAAALPYAHTMYLTRVLADIAGDVYFPPFESDEWSVTRRASYTASSKNEHAFVIEEYARKSSPAAY